MRAATGNTPTPSRGGSPDRRQQRRWVPITIGWLCFWIGLADVVNSAIPRLHLEHRLHRITPFVPGVLTNVTATADVIIGLALLMLSHGLRRRKRRAWQAVSVLLLFSIVIHVVHAPYIVPGRRFRDRPGDDAVLPGRVLRGGGHRNPVAGRAHLRLPADRGRGHRPHLHAAGPRPRARLLRVAADRARGLRPGRRQRPGPVRAGEPQRPVQPADHFAWRVHPGRDRVPVPAPGSSQEQAHPAGWRPDQGPARQVRSPGLAGLLRPPRRQEGDLVAHRQVLRRVPGGLRGHAGQRRSHR